ncbi:hypothetical protein QMK32_23440 [Rhodococcus sp. H29-C3]|nr:hypothetical protein [Rhodococcus sp. H29-C3]
MKAVMMEFNFRVCASPERLRQFLEQGEIAIDAACPFRVQRERTVDEVNSPLLARQWDRLNVSGLFPPPQVWEIGYGFSDPTGRLTSDKLESISKDVTADLQHSRADNFSESAPWILTLATDTDRATRQTIISRYRTLELARSSP